jgi:hypothetical protein
LEVEEQRGFSYDIRVLSSVFRPEDSWDTRVFHSARQKQRRKGLKSKGKVGKLFLGKEIGMNKVVQLSNQTLVERVSSRFFSLKTIIAWTQSVWEEHLGYALEVIELSRNWFALNFLQPEHAKWVLGKNWSMNSSPLLLKPWSPLFEQTGRNLTKSLFG